MIITLLIVLGGTVVAVIALCWICVALEFLTRTDEERR